MERVTVHAPLAIQGRALVSCEHASKAIPTSYRQLGLSRAQLDLHIAWDPGAAIIARIVARRLESPCHLGRWSRLLVDLNRSLGHAKLMAPDSFGIRIPGNATISPAEYERRLRLYYFPYRDPAVEDVLRIVRKNGACLHLSIHSFTPRVGRTVRNTDVGLLYDPAHAGEAAFARRLRSRIEAHGLRVRMNYPYRGTTDGFTTALRSRLSSRRYAALEIETNQALVRSPAGARRLGRILADAIAANPVR
jgi:predicted N-formylglutamate amidohydrolase